MSVTVTDVSVAAVSSDKPPLAGRELGHLSFTINNLLRPPHASTQPATAPHALLRGLDTAFLSVAKSNYFCITDGVSRFIPAIATTKLLIPPAVGSAENRGGYLNR